MLWVRTTLALCLIALGVSPALGQATRTTCRTEFGQLVCETKPQISPLCQSGISCIAAARAGSLEGQRQGEAERQRTAREMAEIAQIEVEIRRLNAETEALNSDRAAADERRKAQRELFVAKVRSVVRKAIDSSSLPVATKTNTHLALIDSLNERIQLLWKADPNASSSAIADAIGPVMESYNARGNRFRERLTSIWEDAMRSLSITNKQPAANTLWDAIGTRALAVAGDDLDASRERILAAVHPAIDSARKTRR